MLIPVLLSSLTATALAASRAPVDLTMRKRLPLEPLGPGLAEAGGDGARLVKPLGPSDGGDRRAVGAKTPPLDGVTCNTGPTR